MFKKFVSIAMGSMLVFGSFSTVFAEDILASRQMVSKDDYKIEKGKDNGNDKNKDTKDNNGKNDDKQNNEKNDDKDNNGNSENKDNKGKDKEEIQQAKEERDILKEEKAEEREQIEAQKDELEEKKDSLESEYEEIKKQYEEAIEANDEELAAKLKEEMDELEEEWMNAIEEFREKLREMKTINVRKYSKDELDELKEKTKQLEKQGMKVLPVENIFSKKDNLKFEIPPVIKDGRTLIPVRAISEGFGADVEWDEEDRTIEITKDETTIILNLEDEIAIVDGEEIKLDTKAEIISNRTVVPLRFIAETLGLKVNWDEDESIIEIEDEDNENEDQEDSED
ncbi:stalk domain-containing protein [Peptostreptococcaceae bacterium AGR-M142]